MSGADSLASGALDPAERFARLRLARSPGIGPKSHAKLLARFGSARAAVEALPGLLATGRWPGLELAPEAAVERERAAIEAAGVQLLLAGEPAYPTRLAALADAPPVLLVRGSVELLRAPSVAVVGARNASTHGRLLAAQMARALAAAGLVVVSGLARGIDTAAHEGALEGPGSTVAVLASGVDRAYPEENAALLERIAQAGCAVSERPLGAEPQARHFPRRNRIIAGLALAVLVVEAAPASGSLITARLALEAGREVMAVPGSPLDPRHQGTNKLLREGAHLVESAADVLAVLGAISREHPPPRGRQRGGRRVRRPSAEAGPTRAE
ncbi:MAG: DNA-processing protein DprA, partial [Geminicoccaceae bacterium]|nr:DNA-processing protein DprA [Geminicoccaceae bacterium]